jgi:GDP-L-fucose synthase
VTKVFIAGHKGMVGSALLRHLPLDHEAFVADRDELNLEHPQEVSRYFSSHNFDLVILAAAKVGGIHANSTQQYDFLLKNLKIQNAVMEASVENNVEKFVFLGSSCVYPKFANQPISEDALLSGQLEQTNDGYALAKITGIRLAKAIFEQYKFNYFSLMPTNLYGPNDNFDVLTSHVPAALMRKFHEARYLGAEEVEVWGSGNPRREFMHVDDMAQATWYMLRQNSGGELINVGTGKDIAIREFAELMAKVVGYQGSIVYNNSKPDGTPRKLLDVSKIHSYGWKHQIELEDGLQQTYHWFKEALKGGHVRGY